mgnify:FL=1
MKARRDSRHKKIFEALLALGGEATIRKIASAAGMSVNVVLQTLDVLAHVKYLGGKGGESRWKII